MRRKAGLSVLLLGGLLGSGCRPSPPGLTEAHAAAIRDSVGAVVAEFQRHSANARWDSLGALYSDAPGFRFLESGAIQYRSADEVRAALAQVPPSTVIVTTYRDTGVDVVAPGVAVVSTLFETVFSDSSGPRFSFAGALTVLWMHEPEGWRIRGGHSSAPVPRGG